MSVTEMRPAAAPDKIPTADELVGRARALAPKLRERAVKAERDRNLPRESVEEYIGAGLLHTLQPKRWGGYEHDHEVAFNIAVELGKSTCASSAWVLNYFTDHACILAHFPDEAQHDVWSRDKAACIATSAAPTGKVSVTSGGYHLNGRWSWCSGLRYSQWIMIGGSYSAKARMIRTCGCSSCRYQTSSRMTPGTVPACAAPARSPRCAIMYSCRSTEP